MSYLLLFGCLVAVLGRHGTQGENYDEEISVSNIVKRSRYTTVRRLSVIAIEARPYVTVRKTARGDNHFEGFTVDLLDAVCARLSCRYSIYMSEEGIGGPSSGMIGEVSRGAADLALGPIAMTGMRRQAVDFSIPWLDVPLSVLIRRDTDITSLKELIDQDTIRYGISISGVAMSKFIGTKDEPYSRMAATMSTNPSVYVTSVETGLSRVLNENYSLILDQPTAEYLANKRCELTTFGEFLDDGQGYGFAMTKGDRLIPTMNDALAAMKHDGTIKTLYKKWWNVDTCRPERVGAVSGGASLSLGISLCAFLLALCSVFSLL